jgi:hypothetical protein
MKSEMVFETSVSTKAEPHCPAENPKELLHENAFFWLIDDLSALFVSLKAALSVDFQLKVLVLHCHREQTGSGVNPASYKIVLRVFPWVKQPEREVDHLPPTSAEVKNA